jgi:response regulator RpfG family c-di-GMP phosphodiesterase
MLDSESLFFAPEAEPSPPTKWERPWELLIVDDDPDVHKITRLLLRSFRLDGEALEMESAYSSSEAKKYLLEHPNTALVLLDVVMETEDAGLQLVHWIRDVWKNSLIRIILRTGQPGAAPEKQVIQEYRINDYKSKTELTELKLFTSVTVALRSYQDLKIIKRSEEGFRRIVHASGELFRGGSREQFYTGILMQLTGLLRLDEHSLYLQSDGVAFGHKEGELTVLAATGDFALWQGQRFGLDQPEVGTLVSRALVEKRSFFEDAFFVGYFASGAGRENIILFRSASGFRPLDREIIQVFSGNVAIAFSNHDLTDRMETTQREIIFTLGEVVESRSQETGNHVRRVGSLVGVLGTRAGLDPKEVALLAMVAPMHDVGKIGIPDDILNKPGPLTANEMLAMRRHTTIGWEILKSGGGILARAAVIARSHHERWDGSGYPDGLAGEAIPIEARLTALCDVFDALYHDRVYKAAMPLTEILAYMKQARGSHFDPHLTDLFLEDLGEALAIMEQWPD